MLAIFALFWVLSAFLTLPFGVRTQGEEGEVVPGTVASAPAEFRPMRIVKRATILAVVLFGAFYLNYVNGWLTADMLDWTGGPPGMPK